MGAAGRDPNCGVKNTGVDPSRFIAAPQFFVVESGAVTSVQGYEQENRAVAMFGARMAMPTEAVGLSREDGHYRVELADGSAVNGRTLIVATGAQYRKLAVADQERFEGLGVHWAATLIEAQICADDPDLVVVGGNSVGQAAIYLSRHAASCRLLIRGGDLGKSMSRYLVDEIERRERSR